MMEPVAHIVIKPNGKRSVTLATQYDPMASSFWLNGERPEGYEVEPLVRLSGAEARIKELEAENARLRGYLDALALNDAGYQSIQKYEARAEAAEALLKEAGKALEPFAKLGSVISATQQYRMFLQVMVCPFGDNHPNDYRPHLEAARSIADKIGGKDE